MSCFLRSWFAVPKVVAARWSADGAYILIVRDHEKVTADSFKKALDEGTGDATVPGKIALASYDRPGRTYRELISFDHRSGEIEFLGWFFRSATALVWAAGYTEGRSHSSTLRLDLSSGSLSNLPIPPFFGLFAFSPTEPLAAAVTPEALLLLDKNGSIVRSLELGSGRRAYSMASWPPGSEFPMFARATSEKDAEWTLWDNRANVMKRAEAPQVSAPKVEPITLHFAAVPDGRGTAILRSGEPGESSSFTVSSETSYAELAILAK